MSTIAAFAPSFIAFQTVDPNEAATSAAVAKIRNAPYQALRRIDCHFYNGVMTLRGRVPSYYMKQYAQEMVGELASVQHVNNELEVVPPPQWDLIPPSVRRTERARRHNS